MAKAICKTPEALSHRGTGTRTRGAERPEVLIFQKVCETGKARWEECMGGLMIFVLFL